MNCVYHGSYLSDLDIINPKKSTHQKEWVYATKSKTLALIFISKKGNDFYYYLGGGGTKEDLPILVERKEGMFKDIFGIKGSIYTLDAKNFMSNKTGWNAEVVSCLDEKVVHEEKIDNVYNKLIEVSNEGKIKLYLYPDRPDFIPIDNSDLIPKVMRWEQHGFNTQKFFDFYPELKEKYFEYKNSINS